MAFCARRRVAVGEAEPGDVPLGDPPHGVRHDVRVFVPQPLAQQVLAEHHRASLARDGRVFASRGGVPVVLHGVLGAAGNRRRDVGPAVPETRVRIHEREFLLLGPRAALDVRPDVVVPALAALFPRPLAQAASHFTPLATPVPLHERGERRVLGVGPAVPVFNTRRSLPSLRLKVVARQRRVRAYTRRRRAVRGVRQRAETRSAQARERVQVRVDRVLQHVGERLGSGRVPARRQEKRRREGARSARSFPFFRRF